MIVNSICTKYGEPNSLFDKAVVKILLFANLEFGPGSVFIFGSYSPKGKFSPWVFWEPYSVWSNSNSSIYIELKFSTTEFWTVPGPTPVENPAGTVTELSSLVNSLIFSLASSNNEPVSMPYWSSPRSPTALSISLIKPLTPSLILLNALSITAKGVKAFAVIFAICSLISFDIMSSTSDCKVDILFVIVSKSDVKFFMVLVFCNIATGELGNFTLSFLIFLEFGFVIPTGLSPEATAAKSSVSVIGNFASVVSKFFASVASCSNFSRIWSFVLGLTLLLKSLSLSVPAELICAAGDCV